MKTSTGFLAITAVLLLVVLVLLRIEIVGSSIGSRPPSRVSTEIMELIVALQTYQIVHGQYPSDPASTERLKTNTTGDPSAYISSSEFLYRALSGEHDPDVKNPDLTDGKCYYVFKPAMLRRTPAGHVYVVDPDGNSYGYSTLKAVHPESPDGNNPTFDLWSTHGHTRLEDRSFWYKNW